MTKKLIALFLAIVTCVSIFAGCKPKKPDFEYTEVDLEGAVIDICVVPQEGLDHNNCYLTKVVEAKLKCDLKYLELDDFGTTYVAQLSDGVAPDITWYSGYSAGYEQYGMDGAYINIYEYLDQMPNVKAYLESKKSLVEMFETEDGKLYVLPQSDVGGSAERYAYLYREDIFAENNLTWPTNQEEFENVLYTLKNKYGTTPFTMRGLNNNLGGAQNWGFLWGASHIGAGTHNTLFTLDENGNYYNGLTSDAYKEMGQYLQWLKKEGLLDASSFTHTAQTWYEAMASNRAFITYDKVDRLPYINMMGKTTQGEDFQMIAGTPFNMGTYATKTTEVITDWSGESASGYLYLGKNNNLSATLKYVDWLFSEDGFVTTNWGVKGESYDVDENGNKYYLESFMDEYGTLMTAGLNYNTTGGQWDYTAFLANADEKLIRSLEVAQAMGVGPRQYNLKYDKRERRTWDTYYKPCGDYARAQWMQMVTGNRSWDDWDKLKEELQSRYHEEELRTIAYSALERISYKD